MQKKSRPTHKPTSKTRSAAAPPAPLGRNPGAETLPREETPAPPEAAPRRPAEPPPGDKSSADRAKLDPSLWDLIEEPENTDVRSLSVFLRLDPDKSEMHADLLARTGIEEPLGGTRAPVTAMLSPREVKSLSHEPAVTYIRLARALRPIGEEDPP